MVLAENNRLNLYEKIAGTFGELMAAARGQVACTITSAEVPTSLLEHQRLACFARCLSTLFATLLSTLFATLLSTLFATLLSTLFATLLSTLCATLLSTLFATLLSTLFATLLSTLFATLLSRRSGRRTWRTSRQA